MGTNSQGPGLNEEEAPAHERPLRLIKSVEQEERDKKHGIFEGLRLIPGVLESLTSEQDLRLIHEPGTDSPARFDSIPPPETEADASARLLRDTIDYNRDREARGDDR